MKIKKYFLSFLVVTLSLGLVTFPVHADTVSVDFEPATYTVGNINGQDGWLKTGPFDVAVVANSYGFSSFGSQSLRTSDAVVSGSFGDQTFAKPLNDAVGEVDSTDGAFSRGTLQRHFEMQFDIASTMEDEQSGMHVSVSPDRGDGSRMSYLRFDDSTDGIDVFFDDVRQTVPCTPSGCANFVETQIGTDLSRTVAHNIKLTLDTLDGPSNDVVKVWIDGSLVITGTSWEDYYRYDPESVAEQSPRIVKTVLFRESGDAHAGNIGNGFLFDNLSLMSGLSPLTPPTDVSQCKKDGWKFYTNPVFKNQGDCISYLQTPKATGGVGFTAYDLQRYAEFNAHQLSTSCSLTEWNLNGAYTFDFEYLSGHYVHDATISGQVGENYNIAGGYPAGGSFTYEWGGTGIVAGNTFTNSVDYTLGAIGTHMDMVGTLQPDGSMSGTWTDNFGGTRSGTWLTATGNATKSIVGCTGKGTFHYSDVNGSWYNVDIEYVKVSGTDTWFAGPVTNGNVGAGQWLFAKVHDGGTPGSDGDLIWGSFTDENTAKLGVAGMTDPSDGSFEITSGNLVVH